MSNFLILPPLKTVAKSIYAKPKKRSSAYSGIRASGRRKNIGGVAEASGEEDYQFAA
jgi:hypothetical protein